MKEFIEFARTRRALVEGALSGIGAGEPRLSAAARDALTGGGKRLRPLALFAAGEALGAKPEALLPAAAAVECIHAASLSLDDLPCMDNAEFRRSRTAIHKAHGEWAAILAAVGLIGEAFLRIQTAPKLKPAVKNELARLLAETIGLQGLSAGQALDLAAPKKIDLDGLEAIHRLKTAVLFVAALEMGAICAGASKIEREIFRAFGRDLGLAYQVIDDLLDAEGDPAKTGKPAHQDASRTTFYSLLGGSGSRALARELTDAAVSHLKPLGKRSTRLKALAEMMVNREA
jgi:geranylgeranyl pyrophosphate synthase